MADSIYGLFDYPTTPHRRRHGPLGYANYEAYKPWLRDEFAFRCVYCLLRERWFPSGSDAFSVEHVAPQSIAPARIADYTNLVYACNRCNSVRQNRPVLNPCDVALAAHLQVNNEGVIEGLTREGVAHIKTLRLDDPKLTEFRERIIQVCRRWDDSAVEEALSILNRWLAFPDDLPNLSALRPPNGNSQPDSIHNCWYELRKRGALPDRY